MTSKVSYVKIEIFNKIDFSFKLQQTWSLTYSPYFESLPINQKTYKKHCIRNVVGGLLNVFGRLVYH